MLKIGLTGGIGCGKSAVLALFKSYNIQTIDADYEAKQLMGAGSAVLEAVFDHFGKAYQLENGELDRKKLRSLVFSDSQALQDLELITHPAIKERLLFMMSSSSFSPYIVVDIPLLFEKGYQSIFDAVIVVDCTVEQQYNRVKIRDNVTDIQTKKIVDTQMERADRIDNADFIIDNTKSIAQLVPQVESLHNQLLARNSANR